MATDVRTRWQARESCPVQRQRMSLIPVAGPFTIKLTCSDSYSSGCMDTYDRFFLTCALHALSPTWSLLLFTSLGTHAFTDIGAL